MIDRCYTWEEWQCKLVTYWLGGSSTPKSVLTSNNESQADVIEVIQEQHPEYQITLLMAEGLTKESYDLMLERRDHVGAWNL
jgi:hypothetical protein